MLFGCLKRLMMSHERYIRNCREANGKTENEKYRLGDHQYVKTRVGTTKIMQQLLKNGVPQTSLSTPIGDHPLSPTPPNALSALLYVGTTNGLARDLSLSKASLTISLSVCVCVCDRDFSRRYLQSMTLCRGLWQGLGIEWSLRFRL